MTDLGPEAQALPKMSFALLPSLALKTFVFALLLGITCLIAYAFAFLFSFDRSKGGFQGPPQRRIVLITAVFTIYFYFSCCAILYAYSDNGQSFDFYYVLGWGMAIYLTIGSVLFISLVGLAALWLYLRHRVDTAMWTLTDATRGEHQRGEEHAEGGEDTGNLVENTSDNVPLMAWAEGEGGADHSKDKSDKTP